MQYVVQFTLNKKKISDVAPPLFESLTRTYADLYTDKHTVVCQVPGGPPGIPTLGWNTPARPFIYIFAP